MKKCFLALVLLFSAQLCAMESQPECPIKAKAKSAWRYTQQKSSEAVAWVKGASLRGSARNVTLSAGAVYLLTVVHDLTKKKQA